PPTSFYTLSLHDALPISPLSPMIFPACDMVAFRSLILACLTPLQESGGSEHSGKPDQAQRDEKNDRAFEEETSNVHSGCLNGNQDRKSTRLNSSHVAISY